MLYMKNTEDDEEEEFTERKGREKTANFTI